MAEEEKMELTPAEEAPAEGTPAETEDGKKKKEKVKKPLGQEILEWVLTIVLAVAAAAVIRSLVFEPVRVDGASMNDTLVDGEVMFVSKWDYASTWLCVPWQSDEAKENATRITTGAEEPEQFDVVIARYPGRGDTNFVKRLIGMPGDRVKIEDGYLYINDVKYDEEYVSDAYREGIDFDEVYIPKAGDSASLELAVGVQNAVVMTVNGEVWPWAGMSSALVNENGDRLVWNKENQVILNGEVLDGEGIYELVGQEFTVEKDCYFVMGDHRNNSNDSRAQGPITRDMIIGHVRVVMLPFSAWRSVK